MSLQRDFQKEVETFLQTSGMTSSAFGRRAVGDPNFVLDLRAGRTPSLKTVERIRAFIRKH